MYFSLVKNKLDYHSIRVQEYLKYSAAYLAYFIWGKKWSFFPSQKYGNSLHNLYAPGDSQQFRPTAWFPGILLYDFSVRSSFSHENHNISHINWIFILYHTFS